MDHSYRKVIFKICVFFIVLIVLLLFIVEKDSAEYVILILSLGVNLFLSVAILLLAWMDRNRGSQKR
ncbi:hypothetical protein [Paenibacillus spongiae]|uniref:Uncharacterized protein n=1 Tax=Paenibacillus spongiae TaxID=2909671 RepID=A0ABY5S8B7_9BACL|nr:hypothetical protein [Paenibacillus spongiae]UVI29067.1 hypothetical protein L1F29_27080 [Paenibacillus spongiae]